MNYEEAMQDFLSGLRIDKNVINAACCHQLQVSEVIEKLKPLIQVRYYKSKNVKKMRVNVNRNNIFVRFEKEYPDRSNKQLTMFGF